MAISPMDDIRFASVVSDLVTLAKEYRDDREEFRLRAVQYYDGVMRDTEALEGYSSAVSRDVRAMVNKVLPSVVRTICGGEGMVKFEPTRAGEEEQAEQATEFFNTALLPECDAEAHITSAIHDALLQRNGILHWYYDERVEPKIAFHKGLNDLEFEALASDPGVEIIEDIQTMGLEGVIHDVRSKRIETDGRVLICAVPLEQFLIHPDAVSIETSPIVGRIQKLRRSDLVAMGYDPEVIAGLPVSGDDEDNVEEERRDLVSDDADDPDPSLEEVDYYDLYVRIDADGDGLAELRRVVMAGGCKAEHVLVNDYADEAPFCDLVAERKPHHWEGVAIADDMMPIQRIKTVLLRGLLDNVYMRNAQQPIVAQEALVDPQDVLNPQIGKPIRIKPGHSIRDVIQYNEVPFIAADVFNIYQFIDRIAENQTGITEASAGLAPDALQNMTAKASAMIENAGIGRTELMVRNIASGLRKAFAGMYRLFVRYTDKPRVARLTGGFVEVDPRHWNANLDVTVNVGQGAGTRERDLMMAQAVLGVQERLVATLGADNPFVKPENVYNAVMAIVGATGMQTPRRFITKPDKAEVNARLEAARNKPDPEQMKIQAQMAIEDKKIEASKAKEVAQGEADIAVAEFKSRLEAMVREQEARLREMEMASRERIELAKIEADQQMQREKLAVDLIMQPGPESPLDVASAVNATDAVSGQYP